ncbi:sensor histidine kinase [Sutcliffiella halmapala]|uniref:sensor histidine kinase n=1 Tax=Sutcliffiella halmapala TaxID=79882 RepID=UPI000994B38E|nr:histidine kinase [Sutcliffiella halmapala]
MISIEGFSIYIMISVLAPLIGVFTLLFLFIFEERIDLLEKQKREIALERELQTARYNQLTQEIQPHFFFNTLNSILSLARLERKEELVHSIETLSKLLKFKYQTNQSLVTIEEELNYVQHYLDLQKVRFRDKLQSTIYVDPEVKEAIIIPYLVQTFVENAFKHSFEKYLGEATLRITIEKKETEVYVTVWNSTQDSIPMSTTEVGIGLENINRRLDLLFPTNRKTVQIVNDKAGTSVIAIFPYELHTNS